ncbi:MAG: ferritin [Sphingobacteriales bacterium]|jgi:ferritin
MISNKMNKMMNDQYALEQFSSNQYLAMCSYFTDKELEGFANFFKIQSEEETMHAEKFFTYIHDAGGKLEMQALSQPLNEFKSILEVIEITLANEQRVSKSINGLVKLALQEDDFATHAFLNWFVTEQVEEESSIKRLIGKLNMIGDNSSAVYLLDAELGKRNITA